MNDGSARRHYRIHSCVLQPDQIVSDLRTGIESINPAAVTDYDMDALPEASFVHRVSGDGAEVKDLE